ncbi:hypothetical protein GPJ56_005403 [Histomonas meleagridis]|uniref:uncharacterized protein n=1 Tax=Histomonas meleagridis TaxID=135588 RepID=UPI003559BC24|nr:hypothetical protein GPJ56_005403 [Histomonas meleagridis]KAH0801826.1 hypothetical protein GO595_005393 [Histomonas meleagridis]
MASKLQDHVGLLHDSFDDLLKTMFSMISAIQDETNKAENPNQIQFDQLPSLAERIVKKVQSIDILIDETIEETFLGKDIEEIKELLALKITEYEDNVMSLQNNCRAAEQWIGRIQQMLDVIAENTPWIHNCYNDNKEN